VIAGKTVLVTGAGGSIGSVLCERIAREGAKRLKLLSLTENALYTVTRRLKSLGTAVEIDGILGSVTDSLLVREVLEGVDIVIHAAAHKHVPICEQNPVEAVLNNVFGTQTLLDAVLDSDVERFVLVSTDKAVRPVSVMGATKRVSELLVKKAARRTDKCLSVVRFGNVLDSAGSVLPLWREQIACGGPLTLTDERCERYFMSIPEACELILGTLRFGPGTYVFDMGAPRKLADIAANMIAASGVPCEVRYVGLRPGEKLTEELHNGDLTKTPHPKILRVAADEHLEGLHLLGDLYAHALRRSAVYTTRTLFEIAAYESRIAA
jgi:FlaA1/EpsC-like NDP-sugar epimerase